MTEGETVSASGAGDEAASNLDNSTVSEHDPHFEPIVTLPEVVIPTMEEEEEEMIKLRAKLFRFDSSETPSEWKDRGTGEVKLLKHRIKNTVRVVMRRDKTLKICANHFVTPWMKLEPNCGSDRAWVWSVKADYTHESPRSELLAIRFTNAEVAQRWKEKFEEAKELVAKHVYANSKEDPDADTTDTSESDDVSESEDELNLSTESKETEKEVDEAVHESTNEVAQMLEKLDVTETKNPSTSSLKD